MRAASQRMQTVEDVRAGVSPHPNLRYARISTSPRKRGARSSGGERYRLGQRETPTWEYAPERSRAARALQGAGGDLCCRGRSAWVTTVGPTGVVNAAPFSFFNVFCEDPPLCMFAVQPCGPTAGSGTRVVNIERTARVRGAHDRRAAGAGDARDAAATFRPRSASPTYLGLILAPSSKVAVPRLADAPWAMECKAWKTIDVKGDRVLVMGEGINFHIRDELWDSRGDARAHGALSS